MRKDKDARKKEAGIIKQFVVCLTAWIISGLIYIATSYRERKEDVILNSRADQVAKGTSREAIVRAIQEAKHERLHADPDTFVQFWTLVGISSP